MDEVISLEESKGTGNMELQLDKTQLANRRIYPAIDIVGFIHPPRRSVV